MVGAVLAVMLSWIAPSLQAQDALALALIEESYRAYRDGLPSAARELARRALDFSEEYGDPFLVLAVTSQDPGPERRVLAERALQAPRFARFSPVQALRLTVQLLAEAGEFQRVEDLLSTREETTFDADLAAARAHALLALGRPGDAQRWIQAARQRFPESPQLVPYLVRYNAAFPEWESRLGTQLSQADWWPTHKRLVLGLLPVEPAPRALALRALARRLPDDPDVVGWLVSQRLTGWEEALSLWDRVGLPRDLGLTQQLGTLVPQSLRMRWTELCARQEGVFTLPLAPLHPAVESRRFIRGRLVEVTQDRDNDGLIDFGWTLEGGLPKSWFARLDQPRDRPSGRWELRWGRYPYLDRAIWYRDASGEGERRVFSFPTDAVRLEDVALVSQAAFPGTQARPLSPPDLAVILPQAVRLRDYDAAGRLRRRHWVEGGQVYLIEEDRTGQGRRDTVVLLRSGQLDRVWRDVEGAGRWQVFQRYSDGLPQETLLAGRGGRASFLWRGLDEGLFLIGEAPSAVGWPTWQQGLARLRLESWNGTRPPNALPTFPQVPFDSLGDWE